MLGQKLLQKCVDFVYKLCELIRTTLGLLLESKEFLIQKSGLASAVSSEVKRTSLLPQNNSFTVICNYFIGWTLNWRNEMCAISESQNPILCKSHLKGYKISATS